MRKLSLKSQRPQLRLGVSSLGVATTRGASSGPTVFWNPSDKDADITLATDNRQATISGATGWNTVRANTSKAAGKWYYEVEMTSLGNAFVLLGVATSSLALNDLVGNAAGSWSYFGVDGTKWTAGGAAAYGATFTTGDVIGVALDLVNGKIFYSKNNTWQASGDPVAGTNPAHSSVSGTLFPAISFNTNTYDVLGNFRSSDLTYTPPTGFSAWES